MADITASMVQELRHKTGAGMMDCKRALVETAGNMEEAIDYLRKKGLSKAAQKSDRATSEGLIALSAEKNEAGILELNCETDFVSSNEKFIELAKKVISLQLTSKCNSVEELLSKNIENVSLEDFIKSNVLVIGENIKLNRVKYISVDQGIVATYIHNKNSDHTGKIGVLVAIKSAADADKLQEIGKQIAMHIAAAKPVSLNVSELDANLIEKEKEIFREQAKASGKPDNIIEKMVEGRINKLYEEVVLLEQNFIMNDKLKIKDFLKEKEKELGHSIEISQFVKFQLGEK